MKSIKENVVSEIVINKSKFITILRKVNTSDEANKILEEIKNTYKDATHYCYAYITTNGTKASDNGEPSGTAGAPILNVLEKNELRNIIAIVIRYFGGIKLGAGGLVRAYSGSITTALQETSIIDLEKGFLIKISYDYTDTKDMNYFFKDMHVVEKEFNDTINILVEVNNQELELINTNNIKYSIVKECFIEKESNN